MFIRTNHIHIGTIYIFSYYLRTPPKFWYLILTCSVKLFLFQIIEPGDFNDSNSSDITENWLTDQQETGLSAEAIIQMDRDYATFEKTFSG